MFKSEIRIFFRKRRLPRLLFLKRPFGWMSYNLDLSVDSPLYMYPIKILIK